MRNERAKRGVTRKTLAQQCQTSERYLAQIETGEANPSVLVLDSIARALDLDPVDLMPPPRLRAASGLRAGGRARRIALVGLRGAGKSTLGAALAERLSCGFIELDKMVERQHGAPSSELFEVYGQATFRRYERECLSAHRGGQRCGRDRDRRRHRGGRNDAGAIARRDACDLAHRDAGRPHAPRHGAGRFPSDGAQSRRHERSGRDPRTRAQRPTGARMRRLDTSGKTVEQCVDELVAIAERLFAKS